jgi:hypothetical protein
MEYQRMISPLNKSVGICSAITLLLAASHAHSFDLKGGNVVLQGGAYFSKQGKAQNVYIDTLLGDHFSVTKRNDSNGLFGVAYLLHGPQYQRFNLDYGINAFYLTRTNVKGKIKQEFMYDNLAYQYSLTHVPVYAALKANIINQSDKFGVTVDAGIGPNFKMRNTYRDYSIDNGITYPDRAFNGHTSAVFSATAGVGFKVNNVIGSAPVEVGYRFFYLGDSRLARRTNQLLNSLKTGNSYAQALVVSITV